jgi:Flp pilus assembly protein TadB
MRHPRLFAFAVGILVAAAFFALITWVSWVAAYALLVVWFLATVRWRRRQRRL